VALKNSGTHFNNQPREIVLSQCMVQNMRKILTFDFTVHYSRHCTGASVLAIGWLRVGWLLQLGHVAALVHSSG